jgi:hypothetical protein
MADAAVPRRSGNLLNTLVFTSGGATRALVNCLLLNYCSLMARQLAVLEAGAGPGSKKALR